VESIEDGVGFIFISQAIVFSVFSVMSPNSALQECVNSSLALVYESVPKNGLFHLFVIMLLCNWTEYMIVSCPIAHAITLALPV